MSPHLANFLFFVEVQFRHVAQAGLELLSSSHLPALASQSAEIIGMSHCVQPALVIFCFVYFLTWWNNLIFGFDLHSPDD